jgi:hypothetical protein
MSLIILLKQISYTKTIFIIQKAKIFIKNEKKTKTQNHIILFLVS